MRKPSQTERLRRLLSDGEEHSTVEIQERVYGGSHLGIARIASRIFDLRSKGCEITTRKDKSNPAISYYKMTIKPKPTVEYVNIGGVIHARVVQPSV